MPNLLRLMTASLAAALLGLTAAKAEMLQFSTPDGTKSWPKLPDIADWHQDQELSMKLGANFLVPDGADPASAEVTIQASGYPRGGGTLSQLMDKDKAAAAGSQITKRPDLYDKDGTPFSLVAFAPAAGQAGEWKVAAYSEEGDYFLVFTLDAKSKAAYDKNLPIFTALIQKYAREIPW